MLWKRARRSDNVVDESDGGGGGGMFPGGGRLGLGGIVLIAVIGLLSGKDPLQILGQIGGQLQQQQAAHPAGQPAPARQGGEQREFVRAVLGDTEDTWRGLFQASGRQYEDPQLVLFSGSVRSACGSATAGSVLFRALVWSMLSPPMFGVGPAAAVRDSCAQPDAASSREDARPSRMRLLMISR